MTVTRILNKIYNRHLLDRNSGEPDFYRLSLLTSLYGSLTAAPLTGYAGSTAGLTATPDADCHFVDYEVTGGSVNNNTFTYAANDATVKANFARNVHNNTTLTSNYGTITATPTTANSGDVVTLTNTPSADCHFVNYEVTGATLTGDKYMVETEDVSARGVFARNIHNVTTLTSNYGTIATNKSTAYSGDTVTLSNTPAADCHFNSYSITGATLTGSNFKVGTTDVSARGSFSRNVHNLTLQNDGHGTLVASKTTGYSGDTVTLTATPNTNYVFSGYTITGATLTGNSFKFKTNDVTTKAWFSYVSPTKNARIAMRFCDVPASFTSGGKTFYPFFINQRLIVTGYTGDNIASLMTNMNGAGAVYYTYPLWTNGDNTSAQMTYTANSIDFNRVDTVHLYVNTGTTTAGAYEIRGRCNVNNEIIALQQYEWSASQWGTHQVNPRNIKDSNNLWIYGRGEGVMTDHIVAGSAISAELKKENIPVETTYWYNSTAMCAPNPIVQHSDIIADITWTE